MKLEDLAVLMGKTVRELEEMLKQNEVIELNLTEKSNREAKDNGTIEIFE
jgi:hypothetical protein